MSPLILLVLEPEFGFGEADFATGLEVWGTISVRHGIIQECYLQNELGERRHAECPSLLVFGR